MFSAGCVIYEAATGQKLLNTSAARQLLIAANQELRRKEKRGLTGARPVSDIEEDEIHVWLMRHVLGPFSAQVGITGRMSRV
jgi:hypothetical protein